jgi:hypothetical protein
MYKIRGRHSTVYPVQLPNWSCPDIVKELIIRFDKYLQDELLIMLDEHRHMALKQQLSRQLRNRHSHNPSLQSVSSAITNASELSTGTNLNDLQTLKVHVPEADGRENFKLE